MSQPDLSVIIPVYNRGELIRYTLESVRRASGGLNIETIIIDDGSSEPVEPQIRALGFSDAKVYRQENRGLLFARLAGFSRATGRYTLFLDSDDLVSPEKFQAQLAAMDRVGAEVSYTDTARVVIEGDYDVLAPTSDDPAPDTTDGAEFFLTIQPAPHSPVFRTDYLQGIVARAFFPPDRLYNSVAEIWFYHNAAPFPARVIKVPGAHTIIGMHPGVRLTSYWEKLGVASLAVMEAFVKHCPVDKGTERARRLVGEKAFGSWRRLPSGFSPEFSQRLLNVWRRSPHGDVAALGGGYFEKMARITGPVFAGKLFRRWQAGPYEACRTISDQDFQALFRALPAP